MKKRVMYRPIAMIIAVVFSMSVKSVGADPNELLGAAIVQATRLQTSLPTRERLATYQNIFESLDRIVSDHPSSDQAIQILSSQKIGNFDPLALRSAYIDELTRYYDTVCEVSPSYSCLAFVSLKTGNDQCASASTFQEIVDAHTNLKNAARIFIGQKDERSYVSLAMNSYRGCLTSSEFQPTTFASDYFSSDLLDLLLQSDQTSLGRGTIEDMETPYFKFFGVLRLSAHEDRPFDQAFWDRMKRYIKESIPDKNGDAVMASFSLSLEAIRRSSLPIGYGQMTAYKGWGDHSDVTSWSCDHLRSRNVFDMLTTLQAELLALPEERRDFTEMQETSIVTSPIFLHQHPLQVCEEGGQYDYRLMASLHGGYFSMTPKSQATSRDALWRNRSRPANS